MDFFRAQDEAKRNTLWLVLLFTIAVVAIIATIYGVATLIGFSNQSQHDQPFQWWRPDLLITIALATVTVITAGTLFKVVQLAFGGGAAVARTLGGHEVSRGTQDPLEQRLLNVVDEMAIASGVPVPEVYILTQEDGINAFAAGHSTNDAVVAVTQGSLEKLTRDELQGVVAHEFSHLLNGDMRLNLRLMGLLNGILLIALAGRLLMRVRGEKTGPIVLFGLALVVIGYIGVVAGQIIKAAVARQREFLADASAVQFTRNPDGIAGALAKLGDGSLVHTPRAEEASHLFFGPALRFSLFATHPPLEERIRRLAPYRDVSSIETPSTESPSLGEIAQSVFGLAGTRSAATARTSLAPKAIRSSIGSVGPRQVAYAREVMSQVPDSVRQALTDPEGAQQVIQALLVVPADNGLKSLRSLLPEQQALASWRHVLPLRQVGEAVRLPVLELALPALRQRSPEQRSAFLASVEALCRADQELTLFEFTLQALLRVTLTGNRAKAGGAAPRGAKLRRDLQLLLSVLAHAGETQPEAIDRAFGAAAALLKTRSPMQLLPEREISFEEFDGALARLSALDFTAKGRLIEASTAAISADGKVTLAEAELLRTLGAVLDCPIPPFFGMADEASLAIGVQA